LSAGTEPQTFQVVVFKTSHCAKETLFFDTLEVNTALLYLLLPKRGKIKKID
jgi:hypothetical protein